MKNGKRVVRSVADLKGYNDDKKEFDKAIVDSSSYESTAELVSKFMHGEIKPRAMTYTVAEDADPEKAIAEMDVTRTEGFDLSDGAIITSRAKETLQAIVTKRGKKQKGTEKETKADVPPASAPPSGEGGSRSKAAVENRAASEAMPRKD